MKNEPSPFRKDPLPVDPNATPEARALLARLHTLRGKTVLSAQHDYISSGTRYNDEVAGLVGRLSALFGGDFSFSYSGANPAGIHHCGPANLTEPGHGRVWEYDPCKVFKPETEPRFREIDLEAERAALVRRCIEAHRQGRIITLMWHGPVPDCGDVSGDHDLWAHGAFPEERWRELLTPGTGLHGAWEAQVDRIAAHLAALREARVPVLWRPYHEMNGGWFWWGRRCAPGFGYDRLWRMLFARFTEHHGLHNLLWVWNPNAPRDTPGDEAGPYAEYYPGSDCVDVLATDVYHNDYRQSHYDGLLALAPDKLIALGEVGHLPAPALLADQPLWSWIMPWGGLLFRFNSRESIRALYAVLDRP